MCPSHSLVTSGVFKIQNVSSCGLQMSLSYPSLRADGPKCQDPSSAGVHITLDTLALLMGQHLMAKKAALSPLQRCHPSQLWCPNQALWVATLVGTALLHQRDASGGRERIFHRALVFLRGQEQHRFVYLLGETWRLQQLQGHSTSVNTELFGMEIHPSRSSRVGKG